jgi:hypothetical protein
MIGLRRSWLGEVLGCATTGRANASWRACRRADEEATENFDHHSDFYTSTSVSTSPATPIPFADLNPIKAIEISRRSTSRSWSARKRPVESRLHVVLLVIYPGFRLTPRRFPSKPPTTSTLRTKRGDIYCDETRGGLAAAIKLYPALREKVSRQKEYPRLDTPLPE